MRSGRQKSDQHRAVMNVKKKPEALNPQDLTAIPKEKSKSDLSDLSPSQFDSGAILSDNFESETCVSESASSSQSWADSGVHLDSAMDSGLGIESFSSDINVQSPVEESNIAAMYVETVKHVDKKMDSEMYIFQDQDGDSPLHLAVVHGDPHLVFRIVARYPEYINVTNHLSQSALHLAVLMDHSRMVRRLVVCGARVDQCDHRGETPFHVACRHSRLECLQAMTIPVIAKEVKEAELREAPQKLFWFDPRVLQQRNYEGLTCVHLACFGSYKVLEYIVQCGADINAKEGKSGKTVLHLCVESGHLDFVKFLLTVCHAEVNAYNFARRTPLHLVHLQMRYRANNTCADALVKLLREYGGEPYDPPGDSDDDISDSEEECE